MLFIKGGRVQQTMGSVFNLFNSSFVISSQLKDLLASWGRCRIRKSAKRLRHTLPACVCWSFAGQKKKPRWFDGKTVSSTDAEVQMFLLFGFGY